MKRIVSLIIVFILLVSFSSFSLATGTDKEQFRIENQQKSLKSYEKLQDAISKEKTKYLDTYAGTYLDENGEMFVAVAGDESKINLYTNIADNVNIKYVSSSLRELELLRNSVEKDLSVLKEMDIIVTGTGLSIEKNKLNIYIQGLSDEMKPYLISKYGESIEFINDEEEFFETTSITNGGKLVINGEGGSIGFGATKRIYIPGTSYSYIADGIVSVGHFTGLNVGDIVKDSSGNNIGVVKQKYYFDGADCDASFIELNSGYNSSNDVRGGYNITGTSTAIENGYVRFVGQYSNKTGTITDASYTAYSGQTIEIEDTIKVNFSTVVGDSGGPIMYPLGVVGGGSDYQLIGISTGTGTTYSMHSKLANIEDALNLLSIKTN